MYMAVLMKCLIELNSVPTHLFTLLWKSSLDYRSDFISRLGPIKIFKMNGNLLILSEVFLSAVLNEPLCKEYVK